MSVHHYGSGMAGIYDILMSGDFSYKDYAEYIAAIITRHHGDGNNNNAPLVVDLGCGTGMILAELSMRGYDMIGIDNSADMLAHAREKLPNALFLQQEIYDFELYGTVAAFVSTIDCINYITDKRRLKHMFKLVDNYLDPGGLFIFDINTPHRLSEVFANNHFYYISDDFCYLWQCEYRRCISTFDLTFFTREDGGALWRREDEFHRQRAWTDKDIMDAASGSSLCPLGKYAFLRETPPPNNAEKVNYVFQKPPKEWRVCTQVSKD